MIFQVKYEICFQEFFLIFYLFTDFQEVPKKSSQECSNCLERMSGIFKESLQILERSEEFLNLKKYFEWTQNEEKLAEIFQKAVNHKNIEVLLNLTAILEFSVGDIYWTVTRKAPPHLLRDLLETKEIKEVFGEIEVRKIDGRLI